MKSASMMQQAQTEAAHETAETVARRSYGKLVAFLSARMRDVAAAEDALGDAFAAALADWPKRGVPDQPEAWLMAVARRKLIDAARRRQTAASAEDDLSLVADELAAAAATDAPVPDDRLALIFACAATIAAPFLVAPATMGQRRVRAKAKIRAAGIPFRVPDRTDLPERLDAVLAAIYATFAEGWSDPTEIRHRELAAEGIWLGRLV